jgi:hypothetical protein
MVAASSDRPIFFFNTVTLPAPVQQRFGNGLGFAHYFLGRTSGFCPATGVLGSGAAQLESN